MAKSMAKVDAYIKEIVSSQDLKVRNALADIKPDIRYMLAVRGYVRFHKRINKRWAMTESEVATFKKTPASAQIIKDIKSIKKTFRNNNKNIGEGANKKSYTLRASGFRSLDQQIKKYNKNKNIGTVAIQLKRKLIKELNRKKDKKEVYPDTPDTRSIALFKTWLEKVHLSSTNLATPGLSDHGKIKAYDFIVMDGSKKVTSISVKTAKKVWRGEQNWQKKLNEAIVKATGTRWKGPLKKPDEPWHYVYKG